MKNIIQKLLLISSMLLGLCTPAQGANLIGGLLSLTPAAVGSYGTYKTLTEERRFWGDRNFAQACAKFSNAMEQQANPQHPSTAIRAFLTNLDLFKTHEKMAMAGSAGALLVGMVLVHTGFVGSLVCLYRYLRAHDEEKELRKKDLKHMVGLLCAGYISLGIGFITSSLLIDYAKSGQSNVYRVLPTIQSESALLSQRDKLIKINKAASN